MSEKGGAKQTMKDLTAGTVGGVFQVLSAMPFDTIKVRLQVQSRTNPLYSGPMDCLRKTVANEGVLGLYKGTLSPLAGVGACVAIQFGALEYTKRALVDRRRAAGKDDNLGVAELFFAGMVAGGANSVVSSPVEHIRIRMQLQTAAAGEGAAYKGTVDCLQQIARQHGMNGVFKGYNTTLFRETLGYGGYFAMYDLLMRAMVGSRDSTESVPVGKVMLAGGLAGFGMWVPAYPIDVIKTKLQAESLSNPELRTFMRTARTIMAEDGVAGFFRGFTPCMLRAMPVNGATFVGFELAMKLMS